MIGVAISGAGGKLATPITEAIVAADDLTLTSLYNPNRAGQEIAGATVVGDPAEVNADVVVETAHPDVVFGNLEVWRDSGAAAVVGTSGFTPERLEELREMWGDDTACLVVPNFSIGAVLMMRFAEESARHFEAAEIIERHHATKPDAPSGTALASAMGVSQGGGSSAQGSEEIVPGARGGDVEGVRVHSLRLPGVISKQEVAFSNPGELFSIEHQSTTYESFASGALLAVRNVQSLGGGVHLGLDTVME
ncbi:MAG: 4-hydroxy-tetrahydrodipicolinate reductase [Acidimicrobiia bacterium]|jgi:4-hydroxy-tetrahydrodipicolinate reductase